MKKLIVGIDPGLTVGIALFDLNGKLIFLGSKKGADSNWVIDNILIYGSPIIFSTDVRPVPLYVKKLASVFSAKIFFPRKDLSIREKKDITKKIKYKNDHEMDSAAAALFAIKKYSRLFARVDSEISKKNISWLSDEIKSGLVLGKFSSIDSAIKELTSIPIESKINKIKTKFHYDKDFVNGLLKRIDELKREYVKLKIRFENSENRNEQLIRIIKNRISRRSDDKAVKLQIENFHLKKKIEEMKMSFSLKNFEEVIELKNYGKSELLSRDLNNRIAKIDENFGNLNMLKRSGLKLIIADFDINTEIPVVNSSNVNLINAENKLYIRRDDVNKILKSKNNFLKWINIYRKRFYE